MKVKVFLIILITMLSVSYLFYSMDFSVEKKDKPVSEKMEEKVDDRKNSTEQENKKEPEKTDEKKDSKKGNIISAIKDTLIKNENKTDVKKEIINENKIEKTDKDMIFSRNYFKRKKKVEAVKIEQEENVITIEQILSDILNKISLNLIMKSEYDEVAMINGKKVRKNDVFSIDNVEISVQKIEMESVGLIIGTNEVKINLKKR